MSKANSEQLKAIEHHGGVLLKAGAGSGKTFVLKEHMIYLCSGWIDEYREGPKLTPFSHVVKSNLSKIILMTFTKKAAGEISIRLHQEFEKITSDSDEKIREYWLTVCEQLDYLTITTIHGFCFKLIKQGFFPEVDIENEVLSDSQFNDLIENIFEDWLSESLQSKGTVEFVDIILKDKEFVLTSLKSILADPTLRVMWDNINLNKITKSETDSTANNLVDIFKLSEVIDKADLMNSYVEYKGKKWYDFLEQFFIYFNQNIKKLDQFDDLIKINEYFKLIKYKYSVIYVNF